MRSTFSMLNGLVARKVWMRGWARVLDGLPHHLDVALHAAGQARNDHVVRRQLGQVLAGREVHLARPRKAHLDALHAQLQELPEDAVPSPAGSRDAGAPGCRRAGSRRKRRVFSGCSSQYSFSSPLSSPGHSGFSTSGGPRPPGRRDSGLNRDRTLGGPTKKPTRMSGLFHQTRALSP